MKVLLLYDYPPPPAGLPTQGDMLLRGLREMGVEAFPANDESNLEKEWYYRWLHPDVVVGIGYWGKAPDIIHHPQRFGMLPVPWLVADGFILDHQQTLNDLPLLLVTSNWVKEIYIRDGIRGDNIEVLPVGCDTEQFAPKDQQDKHVSAVRQIFGVQPDELMILTVGGDGASKGAREIMRGLALVDKDAATQADASQPVKGHSLWKYVCKVWPQERTFRQNQLDLELARSLGIAHLVSYSTDLVSRNFMPYLINACDIYAAPSRLEGFGMTQIEAGACEKPVVSIAAMAMLDTLVHGKTAFLARVAEENRIQETVFGPDPHTGETRRIVFDPPRIADYRADVEDVHRYLEILINNPDIRQAMGKAARERVVNCYDYRVVARRFVEIVTQRLGIT